MKKVAPVEAKRYILQNRRFRKKYENVLPNTTKTPPESAKNRKQVWIGEADPFPIFLNFFELF